MMQRIPHVHFSIANLGDLAQIQIEYSLAEVPLWLQQIAAQGSVMQLQSSAKISSD